MAARKQSNDKVKRERESHYFNNVLLLYIPVSNIWKHTLFYV